MSMMRRLRIGNINKKNIWLPFLLPLGVALFSAKWWIPPVSVINKSLSQDHLSMILIKNLLAQGSAFFTGLEVVLGALLIWTVIHSNRYQKIQIWARRKKIFEKLSKLIITREKDEVKIMQEYEYILSKIIAEQKAFLNTLKHFKEFTPDITNFKVLKYFIYSIRNLFKTSHSLEKEGSQVTHITTLEEYNNEVKNHLDRLKGALKFIEADKEVLYRVWTKEEFDSFDSLFDKIIELTREDNSNDRLKIEYKRIEKEIENIEAFFGRKDYDLESENSYSEEVVSEKIFLQKDKKLEILLSEYADKLVYLYEDKLKVSYQILEQFMQRNKGYDPNLTHAKFITPPPSIFMELREVETERIIDLILEKSSILHTYKLFKHAHDVNESILGPINVKVPNKLNLSTKNLKETKEISVLLVDIEYALHEIQKKKTSSEIIAIKQYILNAIAVIEKRIMISFNQYQESRNMVHSMLDDESRINPITKNGLRFRTLEYIRNQTKIKLTREERTIGNRLKTELKENTGLANNEDYFNPTSRDSAIRFAQANRFINQLQKVHNNYNRTIERKSQATVLETGLLLADAKLYDPEEETDVPIFFYNMITRAKYDRNYFDLTINNKKILSVLIHQNKSKNNPNQNITIIDYLIYYFEELFNHPNEIAPVISALKSIKEEKINKQDKNKAIIKLFEDAFEGKFPKYH